MLKEERFDFIVKELKSNHKVLFEELASKLGVSEDTIRRDIHTLGKSGLLTKVRGGAIRPNLNPLNFQDRAGVFSDGKRIIGLKAVQLLNETRTIFVDGGTSTMAFASCIPIDTKLRIITNNLALPSILNAHKSVEISILGGEYDRDSNTTNGTQTCMEIMRYRADAYFMGACAIDSNFGVTASIAEEGEVKKAFMRSAIKTIVLGNQEKLETLDFYSVCDTKNVDVLITDLPSDHSLLNNYRKFDIEII